MSLRDRLSQQYRRLIDTVSFYRHEVGLPDYVPRGHFYSALPDLRSASLSKRLEANAELPGINLNVTGQERILNRLGELYPDFDWPDRPTPERRFHFDQGYYLQADSISLYGMMRMFAPKRIVEVGSGFSSALMLDASERFLGSQTKFTFIEPFPERLNAVLHPEDRSAVTLHQKPVQEIGLEVFKALSADDFLIIDSSHVSKIGSDVNYLYFEVLPLLQSGALVHVHDIFWPFEYPQEWIREGRAWNEAYLLRAFLSFNSEFEILFWVPYAAHRWKKLIAARMPRFFENTGASIWLRKIR
jgi:predicted O-methyltransferase YrrM